MALGANNNSITSKAKSEHPSNRGARDKHNKSPRPLAPEEVANEGFTASILIPNTIVN